MRCKFCAEDIQDEAVLCRFCGAVKRGGEWQAPLSKTLPLPSAAPAARPKGTLTIQIAGVCMLISGILELCTPTTPFPFLGALHAGVLAISYHLVYALLFGMLGIGLIMRKHWGFQMLFWVTGLYTAEKTLFMFDKAAQRKVIEAVLLKMDAMEFSEMLGMDVLQAQLRIMAAVMILCWWGFAVYAYLRRNVFAAKSTR